MVLPVLDVKALRKDFPILERQVHGKPLVYLDNAATSQKPLAVIEAVDRYYRHYNSNVHRSVHLLAEEATVAYEEARRKVARFINAPRTEEVIFTRGTTESINLVAYAWGRTNIKAGDEIVITEMEHHSNIVPWHMLAEEKGAKVKFIPVDDAGRLILDDLDRIITPATKLVAFTHVSNAVGTVNPAETIVKAAKEEGALVLIDGAQSVPQMPTDVQTMGADFLAFSGHKMCGPTGIGVLWARMELLEQMAPFHGGGEMIRRVTMEGATYADPPARFEAGTPLIAQAIGLGEAADYLAGISMERVYNYGRDLVTRAWERLQDVEGITLYGPPPPDRAGAITFNIEGVHPHDLASLVDGSGVAIRAGHHCCMPLHRRFGLAATARASFYVYNLIEEIDVLAAALHDARKVFET